MFDSLRVSLAKDVFYFVEERGVPFGGPVFDSQGLPELFEHPALLARHLRWDNHAYADVKIAAPAMRIGQALALLAENLSGLRSFGNLQLFLALQRRNLDLLTERGLPKTDRNFADQIRTTALEERMLFHVQKNVKVAGWAAVD